MSDTFVSRGGSWVIGQIILMLAVLVLGPSCPGQARLPGLHGLGLGLCLAGAACGIAGVLALRCNRTIFPKPNEASHLVQNGIYRYVRHPLYTSLMCLGFGWAALWCSSATGFAAVALTVFLHGKARREERWLREMFPDYTAYQRRVGRFLPRGGG